MASAYLVFVAIDKQGRRQKVPQLLPETPDEIAATKMRCAAASIARPKPPAAKKPSCTTAQETARATTEIRMSNLIDRSQSRST